MARISAYWLLGGLEAWVTGYRVEHLKLGLQMAIALCLSLLPVLIQSMYLSLDRGSSALYTAITVGSAVGEVVNNTGPAASRSTRLQAAAPCPAARMPTTARHPTHAFTTQVAVVLEPSTGDSWRKLILRLLGAGVGGGLSLLVLYIGARG